MTNSIHPDEGLIKSPLIRIYSIKSAVFTSGTSSVKRSPNEIGNKVCLVRITLHGIVTQIFLLLLFVTNRVKLISIFWEKISLNA